MVDSNKIILVGSGKKDTVNDNCVNTIFANTSFSRLVDYKDRTLQNLVLAEGYCDLKQVFQTSNNSEQLYNLRKEKVALLQDIHVENLFVITNKKLRKIREGLSEIKVNCKNLKIISQRRFYLKLLLILSVKRKLNIFLIYYYVLSIIFNKKPNVKYRPSNGVSGAIIFYKLYSPRLFKFDGFLSKDSYYGGVLKKYEFVNNHEYIDALIINSLGGEIC